MKRILAACALLLAGLSMGAWVTAQVNGAGGVYINGVLQGGAGSGTVTSVGLTLPAFMNVSGTNPITSSGTFTLGLANVSATLAFLGPASGDPDAPAFRAITTADLASPDAAGVLTSDGDGALSWETPAATGANTALSNLENVAINAILTTGNGTSLWLVASGANAWEESEVGTPVLVQASDAVAGTETPGAAAGGSVTIEAGDAARLTSGDANGGDIILTPGTGIGTGTYGIARPGTDNILALGSSSYRFSAAFAAAVTTSSLKLFDAGTHYSIFQAQTQAGDVTYTLPAADAAGVLTSNGSGALSWAAAGSAANTALSNLGTVAINAALNPGTDNSIALGTNSFRFTTLRLSTAACVYHSAADGQPTASLGDGVLNLGAGGSSAADAGIGRLGAASLKVTDASTGWGSMSALSYKFFDAGTHYSIFQAQTQVADLTYTLPAAHGTGYLYDNGAGALAWSTPAVTAHDILSATHGDTTAAAVQRGDIIIGSGATPKWTRLGKGTLNYVLTMGADEPGWAAAAGGGANTALSNLADVAINTAPLPASDNAIGLGSAAKRFTTGFASTGWSIYKAASEANPTAILGDGVLNFGAGTTNAVDTGIARETAAWIKLTDGSSGYGAIKGSGFRTTNNTVLIWDSQGLQLSSSRHVAWSSTTAADGTMDVGVIRSTAGVLKVTDGSTGYGDLKLATLEAITNVSAPLYTVGANDTFKTTFVAGTQSGDIPYTLPPIANVSGVLTLDADTHELTWEVASEAMTYPEAGIAVSSGSAWGSSLTAPSGAIVGSSDTQELSNKSFGTGMTWPTFNQNTSGTAAGLSATLALASGGTNADLSATGAATYVLAQDESHVISARALIAADVPDLSGTYLTSVTAHDILSTTHGDTTAGAVQRGDIVIGSGATPKWTRLGKGTQNYVLTMGADEPGWAAAAGGGADTALSNLASVAINTAPLPASDNAIGLGSAAKRFTTVYVSTVELDPNVHQWADTVTLSDNVKTAVVDIAIADAEFAGGTLTYTVTSTDGTDGQTLTGIVGFSAFRKNGTPDTYHLEISESASPVLSESTGTSTLTDTWAIDAGTNVATISVTADSSLTTPTMTVRYQLTLNSANAITKK